LKKIWIWLLCFCTIAIVGVIPIPSSSRYGEYAVTADYDWALRGYYNGQGEVWHWTWTWANGLELIKVRFVADSSSCMGVSGRYTNYIFPYFFGTVIGLYFIVWALIKQRKWTGEWKIGATS